MNRAGRFIPPVLWMIVIFLFSTSGFGSEQTGAVLEPLVRFFFPSISPDTLDAIHLAVRKLAHLTEYAVLAFFWCRALQGAGTKWRSQIVPAFIICALYAASDEWHQSFVGNRTASPVDVLVDVSGAALALAVLGLKTKMRGQA